jgi:hypothetical protein
MGSKLPQKPIKCSPNNETNYYPPPPPPKKKGEWDIHCLLNKISCKLRKG